MEGVRLRQPESIFGVAPIVSRPGAKWDPQMARVLLARAILVDPVRTARRAGVVLGRVGGVVGVNIAAADVFKRARVLRLSSTKTQRDLPTFSGVDAYVVSCEEAAVR
jgi:hypothetical protein